jgi:hypothetical protein
MESEGALAPAIGARRIGRRKLNRAQKTSARFLAAFMKSPLQIELEKRLERLECSCKPK